MAGWAQRSSESVFEPFFTTKRSGTGLGLALVKKTVEAHGGLVQIESTGEVGTSVTLWLPGQSEGSEAGDVRLNQPSD